MSIDIKSKVEYSCKKIIRYNKFKLFISKLLKLDLQNYFEVTVTFCTKEVNQLQPGDIISFENDLKFIVIDAQMESQFSQGKNKITAKTVNQITEVEKIDFYKRSTRICIKLFSTYKEI